MSNERRALVIVEHDPELKKLDEKLDSAAKTFKEKKMFLEKQVEEAYRQTVQVVWEEIGEYLVSMGVLKKYDPDKDCLQIREGVLFCEKRDGKRRPDQGLPDFLKSFFGLKD